jgi:hypothetical protein
MATTSLVSRRAQRQAQPDQRLGRVRREVAAIEAGVDLDLTPNPKPQIPFYLLN